MQKTPTRFGHFKALNAQGFHTLSYAEWLPQDNKPVADPPIICVHGLTRHCRDFDSLAARLCEGDGVTGRRVVSVDLPGRGNSDRLSDPSLYEIPTYIANLATLIAHLAADHVDWVGTSLGGLIGFTLAAQANTPVRRLVMNDIGPYIPKTALDRIASYVANQPLFDDMEEAEAYFRAVHQPFGNLTDEEWRTLAVHSTRPRDDGRFELHYDPGIAEPFKDGFSEAIDLWAVWDSLKLPVFVIHGAESDILSAETLAEMAERGPKAETLSLPGIGHAPNLGTADQIKAIQSFLSN
ncbi:MAG: alpha/beta fold hydrolase [Magnetovibrionaceae bacterium]